MRIALLTEGQGEFEALPGMFEKLAARSGHVFLGPFRVNVDPLAKPAIIARACHSRLGTARGKRAELAVLILDREKGPNCCGDRAKELEAALGAVSGGIDIRVVLKDSKFENWLVADLNALRSQPSRYTVSASMCKKVEPDKADGCDGDALLNTASKGRSFDKKKDAVAICKRLDPMRAARHSRSFRHFLHVIGDPAYPGPGCRRPAAS